MLNGLISKIKKKKCYFSDNKECCWYIGAELAQLVRWMTDAGPQFESHNKASKKIYAYAVGQGTLPKVVMDNEHLLCFNNENGMLKDLM